ncbi:MAG: MFS transporter [Firmicutes bacterium]|uniref:MFS transporter n=1 Tax=Candidatus Onthovivens merdipullorum TaxID=2840889 RepID=A0A9D9DID1_9BACL|nr:MFS transporter [Candidatus Onthovivens merdipullorum]
MEKVNNTSPLKLNIKRTCLIGFAFFGILLLWQVYDSICPTLLTELFMDVFNATSEEEVQYLVGIMMAFDNLAALILLPIFGNLSDKTKSPIGKRMPYILVGTFVCAVAFPFIPILFHYHNLVGMIIMMFIVVIFMMMYRNPAVSLMPDMTPKPLRSRANGIINIMGYIGGAFGTVVCIIFSLSNYLSGKGSWEYNNIWAIEAPFLIASVLMVVSALVLFFTVKENKIALEVKDEMSRGEALSELEEKVDDDKPLSKANKIMLILILVAEFFWFMADNGISTYMTNYTIYYLGANSSANMINTIVGGVGSVIGFAIGGVIASKISRKWTIVGGIGIVLSSYLLWMILGFSVPSLHEDSGTFPVYLYIIWFIKGFGFSLIHVNSYPMVVELTNSKKIGKFTGLYYASSMGAQTLTPILLGLILLAPESTFGILPIYGLCCIALALIIFLFIKNVKPVKTNFKKGLDSLGDNDL